MLVRRDYGSLAWDIIELAYVDDFMELVYLWEQVFGKI